MDLTGIISVSGLPGLHKIVAKTKNGLLVESLADKKRAPIHSSDKVSALEDISIYTTGDDIALKDVLKKMKDKEKGGLTSTDPKGDNNALKKYFKEVLPEFDEDRVYASNIKKVMEWYNILNKADLLKEVKEEKAETENGEAKPKAKKTATGDGAAKKTKKSDQPKQAAVKASSKSAGGPRVTTRKSGSA